MAHDADFELSKGKLRPDKIKCAFVDSSWPI